MSRTCPYFRKETKKIYDFFNGGRFVVFVLRIIAPIVVMFEANFSLG